MEPYIASERPNGIVDADRELRIGQETLDFTPYLEPTNL
jgi:hypothetical protein